MSEKYSEEKPVDPVVELSQNADASSDDSKYAARDEESNPGAPKPAPYVFDPSHESQIAEGVRKSEIIARHYNTRWLKIFLFVSVFCVSYTYSLDGSIRYTFQAQATSSYSEHSLLSTINVARSVMAAATQPLYARLSDVFGRMELFIVSVLFYVVGTIIESQSHNVSTFSAGALLYQLGYTGSQLILEVLVADYSNLNWRLFVSFIPAYPFLVNAWISGDITSSIGYEHWSWGIGMWAFIYPLSAVPLFVCFIHMYIRARRSGELATPGKPTFRELGWRRWAERKGGFLRALFWKLDVVGLLLLAAFLALILVPLTLAGGVSSEWKRAKIIVPLVIGVFCLPVFIWWEARTRSPIVPPQLITDRGVWSALCIGVLINTIWYMQGSYMYTVLVVAVNQSVKAATNITQLYSFCSTLTGGLLGLVITRIRILKPFVMFGTCMWLLAMGLLVHYRGGSSSVDGIIGSLCLLGFGAGLFTYPVQVSIQACTKHENLAVITSLYLTAYQIGSAIGNCISGAIWTQVLPHEMSKRLGDPDLVAEAYGSPFTFIVTNTWGSPNRVAVVESYQHVQRILCGVGAALCAPLICFALLTRNHKLASVQSLEKAEGTDTEIKVEEHVVMDNVPFWKFWKY